MRRAISKSFEPTLERSDPSSRLRLTDRSSHCRRTLNAQPSRSTIAFLMDRSIDPQLPALFLQPVDLDDKLPHLALKAFFLSLRTLLFGALIPSPRKHPGGRLQHLRFPLRHLNRVQVVLRRDLLDRLDSLDRLHGDPGLEFRTMFPSLSFHLSVVFLSHRDPSEN